MGAVWTEDNSIGNALAGLAGNFSGKTQADVANTVEDIKKKRRLAQTEADAASAYNAYQNTQKPTDLSVPLPPEWGGTIALNVPTAQWTDPEGTQKAERNLGQANYALGVLHASSMGDVASNASKLQALEQLNTTGLPSTSTGLSTMQTQLKGDIPDTALKNSPLQDDATMRIEMARLQAKADAGLPLSNAEIITGQQIAKERFGVQQKEGVDENGKPTTFTIGNPPTPGYEKFAAAVGWNGGAGSSAARDPTKTTPPPSVGGGPAGPVVAGPAPPGPSAFSQGAQPITQTPPPAAATTPGAAALPPAVTGPAGVPIAVPPGAPAANAPQPIVPPPGGRSAVIGSTSYGNVNPKDLRTEYEARPAVKQYLIAYDAAQAAYAALKNGSPEADKVALAKLEQAVQASASAGGSQFTPHQQTGEGIGALIRDAKVALVGAGQLSDEQRRSIAAETVKQANVAYERASQETERFRVMARNGGIQNPDAVAPQLPPPPKYDPGRIAKPGTHLAPGPAKTSGAAPKSNLSDVDAIVGLGR